MYHLIGPLRSPLALCVLFTTAPVAAGQDYVFSIDFQGPTNSVADSLTFTPITEADLLAPFSGTPVFLPAGPPELVMSGGELGLPLYANCIPLAGAPCGIEVDGLSDGQAFPLPAVDGVRYNIYFSVDEYAVGLAAGNAPSVFSEAGSDESAADVFVHSSIEAGPIAPPVGPPLPANYGVLDGDGSDYVGLGIQEPSPPSFLPPPDIGDNLDALEVLPSFGPGLGVFFSLDGGLFDSDQGFAPPDSAQLNGGFSGAAILRKPGVGPLTVYAPALALGLSPNDDIDAFALAENGEAGFQPSVMPFDWLAPVAPKDMLIFSVRKGSPIIGTLDSLQGLPIAPGDLLTPVGAPATPPGIFIAAEVLGLSATRGGVRFPSDDLNALAIKAQTITDCNDNDIPDEIDIVKGISMDANENNIPDECEKDYTRYCHCSSGVCNNPDALAGCANSTGLGALLDADGTTSVFANDLVLNVTQLPPQAFGLIYMGGAQSSSTFGSGLRCVAGGMAGTFRYPVFDTAGTGSSSATGIAGLACDNFAPSGCILAGQTWHFQAWYRDFGSPCGGHPFNLSNGLSVQFTP